MLARDGGVCVVQVHRTTVCVAGGGPAGMMLGLLLARAGIDVLVLEKQASFRSETRCHTIHASTLLVLQELGLLDEFLAMPHETTSHLTAQVGCQSLTVADLSHLPGACRFMALMPQWEIPEFLARQAQSLPLFRLHMKSEVIGVIEDGGRVVGLQVRAGTEAQSSAGRAIERQPIERQLVRAKFVIAADGRASTVRRAAGMRPTDIGPRLDMLWFRLPRRPSDGTDSAARCDRGRMLLLTNRGDHWQCGLVIPAATVAARHRDGIDAFRDEIVTLQPDLADRVGAIASWQDVEHVGATMHRLRQWWRPGLLCIGDAAHAMSPFGGVGVNLAIQDAVATANSLAQHLRCGMADDGDLAAVQARREWPVRATQYLQLRLQSRLMQPPTGRDRLPLALRFVANAPALRRIPARIIGLGFRPEHVQPQVTAT
jgi:2-polyprenyl-6-methoxyphenol hydroxylase-like FAD-dependent oxidoreductase